MKKYILILLLLSANIFLIYQNGGFYGRGDNLWYFLSPFYVENSQHLLTKNDFGIPNTHALYSMYGIIFGGFNQSIIQLMTYFLMTFGKLYFTFIFLVSYFKSNDESHNNKLGLYSFLGALFFIFNPLTLQRFYHISYSGFQLFLPLFLVLGFYCLKNRSLYFEKFTLILAVIYIFLFIPFIITNPPLLVIIISSILIFLGANFKKINYKRVLQVLIFTILLSLPHIISYLNFLLNSGNLNTPTNASWYWSHRNSSIINLMMGKGAWSFTEDYFSFFTYYNSFIYKFLFFIVVAGSIIVNGIKKINGKILVLALLLLLLSSGIQEPIPKFYDYLINNLPGFFLFRESIKFLPAFYFLISLLLVGGLLKLKNTYFTKVTFLLILVSIIPFFIPSFLASGGNYNNHQISTFSVPEKYSEYNNIYEGNRVLLLPVASNYQVEYNFGFVGTEDFENRFYPGEIINSPDGYLFNQGLQNKIDSIYTNICDDITFNELSVDKIIYRKYVTLFNNRDTNTSYGILDSAKNCDFFQKSFEDENIIVFERMNTNNQISKVSNTQFTSNLKIIESKRVIFPYLFNESWGIFLGKEELNIDNILAYDYANSWQVSRADIINHVNTNYSSELKKEGYPKTLENGSIDYKYYIKNPDETIDVELTLYFKPQKYFNIGLIISGATFALLILWLILNSIYTRKRPRHV